MLDSPFIIWYARLDSNQRLSAPEAENSYFPVFTHFYLKFLTILYIYKKRFIQFP